MSRRLFVAAWLPEGAAAEAASLQERLRGSGADVRWVPARNLHVTLRFLGEVPSERVGGLVSSLEDLRGVVSPFEVQLGELGAFPPRGRARVIWAGLARGARELGTLAARAEVLLRGGGIVGRGEKRPFQAHVTLGRPRSSRGLGELQRLLGEISFRGKEYLLEEVMLVESRLSPRGAEYEAVARYPLAGGPPPRETIHEGGDGS